MAKADLHIHSNFSDGSNNLEELVDIIVKNNLKIVALTDHDTVSGNIEMESLIPRDISFIKGVELTCTVQDIKCHILGYDINPKNEELNDLINLGKQLRKQKLETRIEYLKNKYGIEFTKEELDWLYSRRSVVKTHIANLLVKRGLASNNVEAMKNYIDACKTGNTRFDGIKAISAIKSAGGIPVWAHPLGGEGEKHISKDEFLPKLNIMISCGIKGLECYYSRYNQEEIEFLVDCAAENNLMISGGSDYHGENKQGIPIGKLNTENTLVDSSKLTITDYILNF